MNETRNSKDLESFIAYCKAHPDERFWQALRNWAGYPFVYVSRKPLDDPDKGLYEDTFYWERTKHGQ